MTSIRNPLQDFVLTPQQQNLLFAALNSNRAANAAAGNNALSLSPSAFNQSPPQKDDINGFQESPYLDYDYPLDGPDSSYDFSFDNGTNAKMIGDLPGSTDPKSDSSSPEADSPDKRSHPEDDGDEEENEPKRRESTEKVPKKPGRKPLTSEPTSKRKAQNRAAQRAFRERKEKHVKDLENKVAELEKVSEEANHENDLLRAKVDKMSVELTEYKKRLSLASTNRGPLSGARTFGNPIFGNINDVNFQFEFPKFGQLPGPTYTNSVNSLAASLPAKSSPNGTVNGLPSPTEPLKDTASPASSTYISGLDAQTKEDLARLSGIFSPPLTNGSIANASRGSMDSHYSVGGGTTTSSPSASSGSNMGPSSSCGTSPEPYTQSPMGFKPLDTLTTIGEEQTNMTGTASGPGQFANIDINDMGWLAPTSNFEFDPQLFGNYREPQDNILANGGLDDSFFNDAVEADFTTPYNMAPSPVVQKKSLISEIDAAKEDDTGSSLLTCNNIWEKLQNCPKVQNGDFDLDGLCADLQKKAKCSGHGAVIDEKDFRLVMKKYCTDKEKESEGAIKAAPLETTSA